VLLVKGSLSGALGCGSLYGNGRNGRGDLAEKSDEGAMWNVTGIIPAVE